MFENPQAHISPINTIGTQQLPQAPPISNYLVPIYIRHTTYLFIIYILNMPIPHIEHISFKQ
mgnify:CR=1 FL=1